LTPVDSLGVAARDISTSSCESNVGYGWRTYVFNAPVITSAGAEIVEESFASTEQDRHDRQMQFIDERIAKVLPDGGCAASDEDITFTRCFESCAESCPDPAVDEMEGCSPLHFDWRTWMVSEYEHRVVKRGILSPPAVPIGSAPRATNRSEHVPTHDGGAHTGFPPREEFVVEPLAPARLADHSIAASGGEQPVVELHATHPEWIVEILMGPSDVPIQGDRQIAHKQSRHWARPPRVVPTDRNSHSLTGWWHRLHRTGPVRTGNRSQGIPDRRIGAISLLGLARCLASLVQWHSR